MTGVESGAEPGRYAGTRAGIGRLSRVLVARLGPDEDILPATQELLLDAGITTAVILSGVASLQQATVRNIHRFPDRWPINPGDRRVTTIAGPLEVLAMQGNVAPGADGALLIHCHLCFSVGAPPAVTYGGHLVGGTIVATTCELFVAEVMGLAVRRPIDEVTMAPEITVDPPLRH